MTNTISPSNEELAELQDELDEMRRLDWLEWSAENPLGDDWIDQEF